MFQKCQRLFHFLQSVISLGKQPGHEPFLFLLSFPARPMALAGPQAPDGHGQGPGSAAAVAWEGRWPEGKPGWHPRGTGVRNNAARSVAASFPH